MYLQDAIRLKQREGMILLEHGLLYLDPQWINKLFRAVLDHQLKDPNTDYWMKELRDFSKSIDHFFQLSNTHQTFRNTGTLTVSYLYFLWREVNETQEEEVFKRLLLTMRTHGVLFSKWAGSVCRHEGQDEGIIARFLGNWNISPKSGPSFDTDSSALLFVPVLLGPYATEEELEAFSYPCNRHMWRWQLVYRIYQSYVPPGIIGMVVARLLCSDKIEIRFAWRGGISFMIGGGEGIIVLRHPPETGGKAEIEIDVVGPPLSEEAKGNLLAVAEEVRSVLKDNFRGLMFDLDGGTATLLRGENALMDEIKGLREDVRGIDEHLADVQTGVRNCLVRLTKLQASRYPHLVVIRKRTPVNKATGGREKQRVLSGKWFKSAWQSTRNATRRVFTKDMRLVFVCPHDITEVRCGPNGEGFPLEEAHGWVKKLLPAAQVGL